VAVIASNLSDHGKGEAMLVLTRKKDETITIGEGIEITVIRVRGNSVRIGIKAPQEVRVVRGELGRRKTDSSAAKPKESTGKTKESLVTRTQDSLAPIATENDSAAYTIDSGRTGNTLRGPRFSADQVKEQDIPRKIIIGRTKRTDRGLTILPGPLSEYLQNS
jgi:carbon storage regulator CsrA